MRYMTHLECIMSDIKFNSAFPHMKVPNTPEEVEAYIEKQYQQYIKDNCSPDSIWPSPFVTKEEFLAMKTGRATTAD